VHSADSSNATAYEAVPAVPKQNMTTASAIFTRVTQYTVSINRAHLIIFEYNTDGKQRLEHDHKRECDFEYFGKVFCTIGIDAGGCGAD
jgi:hypothetical protein